MGWVVSVDSTIAHASQRASGARRRVDGASSSRAIRLPELTDPTHLRPALDDTPVPSGGRQRCRPHVLDADKAYAHLSSRRALRKRPFRTAIPQRSCQRALRTARGRRGGRSPALGTEAHRDRIVLGWASARLDQRRGIANGYDKHAQTHCASIVLGPLFLFWCQ